MSLRVTSNYGPRELGFHTGVDFAAAAGTPVISMADGVVVRVVPPEPGKNSAVEVEHPNGCLLYTSPSPRD